MPTVAVARDELYERIGLSLSYTVEEFEKLCFEFGVELDEVMDEAQAAEKRQREEAISEDSSSSSAPADSSSNSSSGSSSSGGGKAAAASASKGGVKPSGRLLYYIATPANRPDLLCLEGIARGFNIFLGRIPVPTYKAVLSSSAPISIVVKGATASIRPFVVCAVLRGVTFTAPRYNSFIDLQDKLHHNICRRRTLVAIGTHDLSTLTPPFSYEALPPTDINFVPLTQSRSFRADELMTFYKTDPSVKHIKPFVGIIDESPLYPVIYDSKRTVLSLPPIINGEHSKISLATRDVFIECTGTDLAKANVVLNTVVAMFSEYASEPFNIEAVQVTYEDAAHPGASSSVGGGGRAVHITPDLSSRTVEAKMSTLRSVIGANVSIQDARRFAERMQLSTPPASSLGDSSSSGSAEGKKDADDGILTVVVPPTRTDVLHECDIIEDVAIAYGFNNITRSLPGTATTGTQLPINKLTDQLRRELAHAGYDETLTCALCARDENYGWMLLKDPSVGAPGGLAGDGGAVVLANPKTEEFQIGRTHMVPGLLKTLAANRSAPMSEGVKLFEVSDVMLLDSKSDVGARNERHMAALYTGPTAGLEIIHGLLDRIMLLLEVPRQPYTWAKTAASEKDPFGRFGVRFFLEAYDSSPSAPSSYFPGRGVRIMLEYKDGRKDCIGTMGALHPKVLSNFSITYPVSVVELNIDPLVF